MEARETPIIDCHIHVRAIGSLVNQGDVMDACRLAGVNVLSSAALGGLNINQNVLCALFKARRPDRVWWFGGLHHLPPIGGQGTPDFATQVRFLRALGCDGMKMIEGKPSAYVQIGRALDDPAYDDYYALLEAERIPLLLHVADPPEFWDPDRVSPALRERGWSYGEGDFPTREQLYEQVESVLDRFRRLPLVLAHFAFMDDDIHMASDFLERHGSVCFDLTPGWGMYHSFSGDPEAWREFFVRYQDRILFGTDNSGGRRAPNPEKVRIAEKKIGAMRTFLTTRGEAIGWDGEPMQCIGLAAEARAKICHANFQRLAGHRPRTGNVPMALERCGELQSLARAGGADEETLTDLAGIAEGLASVGEAQA
jgi:predicted TIM-barrel fold metal-dependent hydrolase